jgi:hypothetical protein
MHGKGTFTWSDGRKFTGEFLDNSKCGYGEMTWPDGRAFKGDWKNDKMHGKGLYKN